MKLRIGDSELGITSCERMRDFKIGFYLLIKVPRENVGASMLYSLLDGTTETIIITADDESEMSYTGFNKVESFEMNATEYIIKQSCVSEAMAQASLANSKIAAAEKTLKQYEQIINNQGASIKEYAESLEAQALVLANYKKTIESQGTQLAELNEQILVTQEELCATYEELELLKAAQTEAPEEGAELETDEATDETPVVEDEQTESGTTAAEMTTETTDEPAAVEDESATAEVLTESEPATAEALTESEEA